MAACAANIRGSGPPATLPGRAGLPENARARL